MEEIIRLILRKIGYYSIKKKWRWHQYITHLQKEDAVRKENVTAWIDAIDHRLLPDLKKADNITVSLTTHDRRVADLSPFAIYSIFRQNVLPNRIVLNINQEKWNDDNLPELLKKLQIAGLEVNFCEDVGPHTKLLPVLQKYPDDIIITVDDDVYYDNRMISDLMSDYKKKSRPCVICKSALVVSAEGGKFLPYTQWPIATKDTPVEALISPHGYCGVLYAPHIFSDEIFNNAVYQSLCKYADDIWFSVMEIREHIPVFLSSVPCHNVIYVNHYNEYVPQGSDALYFSNAGEGRNNTQLQALVEHYGLKVN